MSLPTDPKERKEIPVYSGCIKYFPDALAAVAALSKRGNDQHNPDKPLHWDRSKSGDELDAMMRHVLDEDWDAVAWRALANLQKQIEQSDAIVDELDKQVFVEAKKAYEKKIAKRNGYRATLTPSEEAWNIIDEHGRMVGIVARENIYSDIEAIAAYLQGEKFENSNA